MFDENGVMNLLAVEKKKWLFFWDFIVKCFIFFYSID